MSAEEGEPKYLSVARAIEAGMGGRTDPNGRMPSVRDVAGTHGVSVVTASRALQVLRDKGLIRAVSRSGSYAVAVETRTTERWALALRATPGPWQQAAGSVGRRGFEAAARRDGFTLHVDLFDLQPGAATRDVRAQVAAARDAGVGGLFLMPSRVSEADCQVDERLVDACRRAELPVVLVERNLRGASRPLENDLVCSDDVAGGAACTRHLIEAGCRRVAFVTASPTSTHEDRLAGYLRTLFTDGRGASPIVLQQRSDVSGKEAYGILASELLDARADGVVCYQDYTAIGLILELLARGLSVPGDVAIAGFDDLPIGNLFAIGVTTYAYPSEGVAREALRLMRSRAAGWSEPAVKVVVPSELIVRESSNRALRPTHGKQQG